MKGPLKLPPSKSHTLRAILFASLARGRSTIENILQSPDTDAMIAACRSLGATIVVQGTTAEIVGRINPPPEVTVDAGNSGIVLRFMAAAFALTDSQVTIVGDGSKRSCKALLDALQQMGARSTGDYAPICVQGPIVPCDVVIDGEDSQPVSSIMIAAACLKGTTNITVKNLGERPWLNLTLDWLKKLGVKYHENDQNCYSVEGQGYIAPFHYRVPADLSSLAFPVVLALLTESDITIEDIDLNDAQGDKIILDILGQMGAKFIYEDSILHIRGPQKLHGCAIDVNDCIDALPILAVVGCFAEGSTHLYNGMVARKKESDRIMAMKLELTKMGAKIIEHADGLTIEQSELRAASVFAHKDHRVALALAVAGYASVGRHTITGAECVEKTYKNFFLDVERLKENYAQTYSCGL
ncbi:MAG: 3-phosphoshikimate 1-carboxyvinyltransferase [Verrucomicrobia bacterium]|nr:3-phosphoshikimate 1-carboxyvinyltransferase [Verrucomicrobiota bacterium]MBS0636958.1 3-phosphoshikimate 1-carboxyvinyltransferase [Verrucomicrobiota bacterium]